MTTPTPQPLPVIWNSASDPCPCPFADHPAHLGSCAEMLAYVERVKARIFARLAHPHPCASCGDLTCADICAACQEDQAVDAQIVAGMVHAGLTEIFA